MASDAWRSARSPVLALRSQTLLSFSCVVSFDVSILCSTLCFLCFSCFILVSSGRKRVLWLIRLIPTFPYGELEQFLKCFVIFCLLVAVVPKKFIRLFVKTREDNKGSFIASVPLKKLEKFSKSSEKSRRWSFKDGWLILEAF